MLFAFCIPKNDSTDFQPDPKTVALRSAVLPGWGQLYLKRPIKSALFFGVESYFAYRFVSYQRMYAKIDETRSAVGIMVWENELSEAEKVQAVKDHTGYSLDLPTSRPRELRNTNGWRFLGVYLICVLDAYVDAHLKNFPGGDTDLYSSIHDEQLEFGISFSIGN